MDILIACEFSGAGRDAFLQRGHNAISCDLEPTEVDGPHFQDDIFKIIDKYHFDMMIAFPPCTYLTVTGNKWFKPEYKDRFPTRIQDRIDAIEFFKKLYNAPIERIAIENPVGIMSTELRKPDQIIHPWWFHDNFEKTTCLWLKNLPPLYVSGLTLNKGKYITTKSGKKMIDWYFTPSYTKERQKSRSRTFAGIARAMAEQWT